MNVDMDFDLLGVERIVGHLFSGRFVCGDLDRDALASKAHLP
jgi:hypothetical protein